MFAANPIPPLFTLAFGWPGGGEWIIVLVIGLLLFGRRLPEVGRSLGRGIVEFKKGIRGIDEEIEEESSRRPSPKDQRTVNKELPDSAASEQREREYAAKAVPSERDD